MTMESFEHPFYDIDIEVVDPLEHVYLIKILSIDGRRFTYEFRGSLDDEAITYVKSVIDAACFTDMLIVRTDSEFHITESRQRLRKHS